MSGASFPAGKRYEAVPYSLRYFVRRRGLYARISFPSFSRRMGELMAATTPQSTSLRSTMPIGAQMANVSVCPIGHALWNVGSCDKE
jgi:hypothetical protein